MWRSGGQATDRRDRSVIHGGSTLPGDGHDKDVAIRKELARKRPVVRLPEQLATLGGHHSTLGGWPPWEAGTGGEKQSTDAADAWRGG